MKCCRWHAARAGTSLVGARCSGRRRRIGLRRRAAREPDCIDVKSLESHRPPPAGPLRTSQITVPPRRRHCEKKIPTCDSSYGFNSTARRRQKSLTVIKKLERPAGGERADTQRSRRSERRVCLINVRCTQFWIITMLNTRRVQTERAYTKRSPTEGKSSAYHGLYQMNNDASRDAHRRAPRSLSARHLRSRAPQSLKCACTRKSSAGALPQHFFSRCSALRHHIGRCRLRVWVHSQHGLSKAGA